MRINYPKPSVISQNIASVLSILFYKLSKPSVISQNIASVLSILFYNFGAHHKRKINNKLINISH